MYKSPIEKVYSELQTQMLQEDEHTIMKAIGKVGVNVDKEELIKALQYDRNQYTKGYEDGKNEVLDKIRAEVTNLTDGVIPERIWNIDVLQIIYKYKLESEE